MKILQILPRNMTFSRRGATSIDLFVAEVVSASRHYNTTRVAAEVGLDGPLLNHTIPLKSAPARRMRQLQDIVAEQAPDVVIVQQHLPTASKLARSTQVPVILQRHNFLASKEGFGPLGWLRRQWKLRDLRSLSGITFVSHATLDAFRDLWPEAKGLVAEVIPNGAYFDAPPSGERAREILCVARASPEKGVLPAVEAINRVLSRYPQWFATILLSEGGERGDYARAIRRAGRPAGERISLRYDVPHEIVRAYNARAAIAVIPSVWREPFGRTALEAHEGGAAVISSGTGGLREISGPHALYLEEVTPAAIEAALTALIKDPEGRRRLGEQGRERASALFRIEKVAANLDAFLESRVAAKR